MAVDSAVMVIDVAKGVEAQTKKLFKVCKQRGIPIFTFVNKLDHFGKAPLDLMDEIENVLGMQSYPMNWPIGQDGQYMGVFDRRRKKVLLFVSDTSHGQQARIADEKISNVIMLPFQPYEDIAHVFSLGDIGLIISKPGIGGSSVPSKTFNILAASRPILASFDRESELCRLIDKYHCGMVAEADSLDEFVSGIRALYSNPEIRRQLGQNGRQYVSDNLGYQKPANQYVDVLENNAKNVR